MEKKITGKSFSNVNTGKVDEQGYWNVNVLMQETIFYSDGTEDTESIEVSVMDMDFDFAHKAALQTALISYREEVFDAGFNSLVEARREKKLNDSGEDNSDTPTQ